MNNDEMTMISKIEGVNHRALTMIKMNKNGVENWAIKGSEGQTTLFFTNVPFVIPYDEKSVLIIGEHRGNRDLYYVDAGEDLNSFNYRRIDTIGGLIYLNELTEKDYLITTDRGEYLFDKETLREKSDLFDSIICMDNSIFFKKLLYLDDRDIVLYGEVSSTGKISKSMFLDSFDSDIYPLAPVLKDESKGYDILDEDSLIDSISEVIKQRDIGLRTKLKTLHRLNYSSTFKMTRE